MNRQPARTFQDLIVWQKAHRFVLGVYGFTNCFPKTEIYGLTSQLRRAAVSIASNVAEGFKKTGRADKARFMNTAQGSVRGWNPIKNGEFVLTDQPGLGIELDEDEVALHPYVKNSFPSLWNSEWLEEFTRDKSEQ